ncbi:hypothetical protein [Ectothiorhodospira marina]|uniref:Fibronectin type-III domain-containing protein n=1 Tax=Ectothiorhodospira marina TaxID=1396821 RepID=A0A1H7LRX4_9GAMM|nr:hypothetical protein [Ectothiorhodospira marina]SEL01703.1 hypothetical protein SAMN05444515_10827 [Ectothiorhodospira marina]
MPRSPQHFGPATPVLLAALCGVLTLLLPPLLASAPKPDLESTSDLARAGYYQLRWSLDEGEVDRFRLEEATADDFSDARIFYEGADGATVISGRSNGTFHYRVRARMEDGSQTEWSDAQRVEVKHHSIAQAFGIFTLGGLVFVATAGIIAFGTRANRILPEDS